LAEVHGHDGLPVNTVGHTSLVDRLTAQNGRMAATGCQNSHNLLIRDFHSTGEVRRCIAIKKFVTYAEKNTELCMKK